MSTTTTLTGMLPFLVLIAALLAYPLSALLLWLYRKAVQRGMARVGSSTKPAPAPVSRRQRPAAVLRAELLARPQVPAALPSAVWKRASNGRWRSAAAYAAGGLCYAVIMTAAWLLATRDAAVVATKLLLLFWTYCWPAVLTIILVAAYDRSRQRRLLGAYFAALIAIFVVALARNPGMRLHELPLYWVLTNLPPTVLVLAFLARPIRAVGSLVLAFLIVVAIGSQSLLSLAAADEGVLRSIAHFAFGLGFGGHSLFAGMILTGMLAFAALVGWPLLRWIGRRYEQKKMSDQSIMIDAQWLLFGLVQSIGLVFEGAAWIVTGLVAFAGFQLVSLLAMRWAVGGLPAAAPQTLLLLRVFALGKRSERLFDKLRKHWQYVGNTTMIAGPDLVTSTVEPHEFLDFVSGRMARQFVTDAQDLERRIATADQAPDHDGRYRISEFFCHDDTWQMTMERLAREADAILMDLRSFSPGNQGCVFELGRLLDGIDLARVLFLVDQSTDRGFLEATLQALWQDLGADSPNQSARSPTARLFSVTTQDEAELTGLLRILLDQETNPGSKQ